jgi:hypothetical protein
MNSIEIKINDNLFKFVQCDIWTGTEGPVAEILFIPGQYMTAIEDKCEIILIIDKNTYRIFTGFIRATSLVIGSRSLIRAGSSDYRLNKRIKAASWDNTEIKDIIIDVLNDCDIGDYILESCPAVRLKRFSYGSITARNILHKLIYCLENSFNMAGIIFFFDNQNIFRFGNITDIRILSDKIEVKKGNNLIHTTGNIFESFALPVQFNQEIIVNSEKRICLNSHHSIKPVQYRVEFEAVLI